MKGQAVWPVPFLLCYNSGRLHRAPQGIVEIIVEKFGKRWNKMEKYS